MIEYLQAAERMKELGMDNTEFLQRAKFVEGVRLAVKRKDYGFRGGWISSAHIVSDLNPRYWASLLALEGYVLHPTMQQAGRSSAPVRVGADKKKWLRLFCVAGSAEEKIKTEAAATHEFLRKQMTSQSAPKETNDQSVSS